MFKLMRRAWRYLTAALTGSFNEAADPKVQLEQAIIEAQDQHRRLKEQAANVIANQKQTEMQLNRAMQELESLNSKARQAVLMADDANKQGDTKRATELTNAAQSFADRLIAVEKQVESLKDQHLAATQASDKAKAAVQQNSVVLQQRLTERQKLLSQLDQAKMQEQMNKAMASLSETVGQDVPTFDEVRDKIESRYAKALGGAEIAGESVEVRMLEVEQAAMNTEATARLDAIRAQLGIASGPSASVADAPAVGEASASPGADGAPPAGSPAAGRQRRRAVRSTSSPRVTTPPTDSTAPRVSSSMRSRPSLTTWSLSCLRSSSGSRGPKRRVSVS